MVYLETGIFNSKTAFLYRDSFYFPDSQNFLQTKQFLLVD